MCCPRLGAGRTSASKKGHSIAHGIRLCSLFCASHILARTMNVLYCVFDSLECNRCLSAVSRTSKLLKARKTRLILPTDQMQCACYEVDEATTAHTRKRPRTPPNRDWPHLIHIVKTLVAQPDLRRQVKHLRIVAYHLSAKTRRKTGFHAYSAVVLALVASTVVRLSIYESRSTQSLGLESFHEGSLVWTMTALRGHVRDRIFLRRSLEDALARMPELTTFILKVDQSCREEDRDVRLHEVLQALSSSPGVISVTITFYIRNVWSAWTTHGPRQGDTSAWSCRRLHMDTWSLSQWWKACFWHSDILMPRSTILPETDTVPMYRLADMLPANVEQLWLHVYPEAFPRLVIALTHLIYARKDKFQALELLGEGRAVMELAGRCVFAGVEYILLVNDAQLRFLESGDRKLQVWQGCRAPPRDWRSCETAGSE
ncbi:hypothetical protein KVT40_000425 [Elsinoe batatas]|uniref:Uncharacterized protein n=1 Tax=Elsinoe batatas TaxID=2601811 RepID=A0A8K0LC17_9PEZI|nr:hypothetical protein KVT40_000425 [Elsinoe batatas]